MDGMEHVPRAQVEPTNLAFKRLLESQLLVDCTLACNGGQLDAHKMILGACSTYLQDIIEAHRSISHPVIILPNLHLKDLKVLVHYMYTGELLAHGQPPSSDLLDTASVLGINSIKDYLSQETHELARNEHICPTVLKSTDAIKRPAINARNNNIDSNDNNTDTSALVDQRDSDPPAIHERTKNDLLPRSKKGLTNSSQTNSSYQLIRAKARNLLKHQRSNRLSLTPNISGNFSGNVRTVKNAPRGRPSAESPKNGPAIELHCPECKENFFTICSYEYHAKKSHGISAFECDICHLTFSSLRYMLTGHMRRHNWHPDSPKI